MQGEVGALRFERLEDGSVKIFKGKSVLETFTPDQWCEVVMFVSASDDDADRQQAALRFHNVARKTLKMRDVPAAEMLQAAALGGEVSKPLVDALMVGVEGVSDVSEK